MKSIFTINNNIRSATLARSLLLGLMLFGLEFDVYLYGPISMRKLAFIAIMFCLLSNGLPKNPKIKLSLLYFLAGIVLLFIYVFIVQRNNVQNLMLTGNSAYTEKSIFQQCLFLFVFPVVLLAIFKSPDEFCETQVSILVFQAVIAILSKLYYPLRMLIYNRFVQDDGRLLEGVKAGVRVGFIGGIGAGASLILFAGCVFCLYFMLKKKQEIKYLCLYFILLIGMVFVGRTGLYMGMGLLFLYFIYSLAKSPQAFIHICMMGLGALVAIAAYILFAPENNLKTRTIAWVGEILIRGIGQGSTVEAIRNMPIPALTQETLWGTGIVHGTTVRGTIIQNDMGYIQTYCAFGLLGCMLYYYVIYGFFAREIASLKERKVKELLFLFLLFIMIAECKEPFLRKTPVGMMLITVAMLQYKKEKGGDHTLV